MGVVVDVEWENRLRRQDIDLYFEWDSYLWTEILPLLPHDAVCGCPAEVIAQRSMCRPYLKQVKILDEGGKRLNVRYHPRRVDGSLELDCGYAELALRYATVRVETPFPVHLLDRQCGAPQEVAYA